MKIYIILFILAFFTGYLFGLLLIKKIEDNYILKILEDNKIYNDEVLSIYNKYFTRILSLLERNEKNQ